MTYVLNPRRIRREIGTGEVCLPLSLSLLRRQLPLGGSQRISVNPGSLSEGAVAVRRLRESGIRL